MLENFSYRKDKSENLQKLEKVTQEVERIGDKLGLKVDQGIKETVAIIIAMGFPTESSCSGHTNEPGDEGYGFPYVSVYVPAPKGWEEDKTNKELGEKWRQDNLKYRAQMIPLLDEFNKARIYENDSLLHLENMGVFGAFTIESAGVENAKKLREKEEVVIKIKQFQEEMRLFTEFLKNKFLNENC